MAAKKSPAKKASPVGNRPVSRQPVTGSSLMTQLQRKYGVPNFPVGTTQKQAVQQFQDVVSEGSMWDRPGVMQAAAKLAEIGHQASAEAYMKEQAMKQKGTMKGRAKRK